MWVKIVRCSPSVPCWYRESIGGVFEVRHDLDEAIRTARCERYEVVQDVTAGIPVRHILACDCEINTVFPSVKMSDEYSRLQDLCNRQSRRIEELVDERSLGYWRASYRPRQEEEASELERVNHAMSEHFKSVLEGSDSHRIARLEERLEKLQTSHTGLLRWWPTGDCAQRLEKLEASVVEIRQRLSDVHRDRLFSILDDHGARLNKLEERR